MKIGNCNRRRHSGRPEEKHWSDWSVDTGNFFATISNLRSSNMAIENQPSVDDMSTKNLHLQKMFNLPR